MEWHGGGNVFIRSGNIEKAGDKVRGHKHNFDHVTIIRRGRAVIRALNEDGTVKREVTKDADSIENGHVLIRADTLHEIEALEDGTVYWCIYAHRKPDGEVIEHYEGWEVAYR
jgi:hypothetical protein